MKKLWFIGIISLIFVFGGIGCGWSATRVARGMFNIQYPISNVDRKLFGWCFGGLPLVDKLDKILDNKTYIVVLQNNTELRASGGFMGSYAVFSTQRTALRDVRVEDIYQPDGQLVGHVDPPAPIQQAFGQGWWKLRDSNWDVDFSVAGEQIAWFFEQGGERTDGIIAVNLSLVNKMLEIFGGVKTVTYDERVTAQNLANLAQTYSEVNKDKRNFLGAVGAALFEKIKIINLIDLIKLINLTYQELQKGQILVWMRDKELVSSVQRLGWDGGLGNYGGDYLYIVESNLGANKANCCVTRSVAQSIDGDKEKVSIKWKNSSQFENPKPPVFWGGNYIDYVRVVIPTAAQIEDAEKYNIETKGRFKIVGFWAKVPAGQSAGAELVYELPSSNTILVRRQPGMDSFPYRLMVDGKVVVSDTIDRDKEYTWTKLKK